MFILNDFELDFQMGVDFSITPTRATPENVFQFDVCLTNYTTSW